MVVFLTIIACLLAATPCLGDTTSASKRVLISDFSSGILSPSEADLFVSRLSDSLSHKEGFEVIDAEARQTAMAEIEFSESGMARASSRLRLGTLLSASHIITGSIGRVNQRQYVLNVQMLNVETGEIEKSISKKYLSLALLMDDARDAVASLLVPARAVPGGYKVMTPETQKSFYFFPLQYGGVHDEDASITIDVHGVGTGIWTIMGRPWGFLSGGSIHYTLLSSVDGESIPREGLQLPVLFEAFLGAGWLRDLSRRVILGLGAGVDAVDFLAFPKPEFSAEFSKSNSAFILDVGVFAECFLLYRFRIDGYIKGGIRAAYFPFRLYPVVQGAYSGGGQSTGYGLALAPSIAIGFGRN